MFIHLFIIVIQVVIMIQSIDMIIILLLIYYIALIQYHLFFLFFFSSFPMFYLIVVSGINRTYFYHFDLKINYAYQFNFCFHIKVGPMSAFLYTRTKSELCLPSFILVSTELTPTLWTTGPMSTFGVLV